MFYRYTDIIVLIKLTFIMLQLGRRSVKTSKTKEDLPDEYD